ncbi:MAG: hypothetical protein IPK71_13080 [Myxococcales bacterium]|nr:hypothetical protein [Myxococcales bacterium]
MVARVLCIYVVLLAALCALVYDRARLHPPASGDPHVAVSTWRGGKLLAREVHDVPLPPPTDTEVVHEEVVGLSPLVNDPRVIAFSVRPGLDGVLGRVDGHTALVTVDDLLAKQAYERAFADPGTGLGFGTDFNAVYTLLAERLGVDAGTVARRAELRRVGFRRVVAPTRARPAPAPLTVAAAKEAVHELALHLARGVDANGYYAYQVDATTGRADGSYNWPRHSGATFFLAQAARLTNDGTLAAACRRAAGLLRDALLVPCGDERCIAEADLADLGSSALALLAFTEVDRAGLDTGYRPAIASLVRFLRSQQRPDGEFMHYYDRVARTPIDRQVLYYSGEASFALARAFRVTGDPSALDAAKRGAAHLGESWRFFGSRYFYGEEHWTCQAAAELVDLTSDRSALAFCREWHVYTRAIQYGEGETPFDAAGGFGVGPLVPPRFTAASSRAEAAGALLDAFARTTPSHPDVPLLEDELRRALEHVLRNRLGRDMEHLFAAPSSAVGRLPGSSTDHHLRIDYEQHAGSALVRWIALREGTRP